MNTKNEKGKMSKKHTPGPWQPQIKEYQDATVIVIANEIGVEIGAVAPQQDVGETEANARLMSLAPEMEDVLSRVVKWDADHPTSFAALDASQRQWQKIVADAMQILLQIKGLER